ncbi:hypothetical protein BJF78_34760 [Pseudonocardia sp. CNS-139]|nr:hypothetical protein BJF78_34760 [Pseudonocardia sp. CNS-139]
MEPLRPSDPARIASYRLIARIGAGGMGQVYLARSPGGRPVALKVIRPDLAGDTEFRDRFVREVTAARAVSGVFTAPVLDADPHGTPAWLATGYVPGIPLDETVTRFGPLPAAPVVTLAAGLAEALAAVHAAGLVHRDVKPSNVMLSADGPKLIDFGIARPTVGAETNTQSGFLIGSPSFLAPEQITGADLGPAVDVWALACVLVHALTGRPPFTGDGQMAVLFQIVESEPRLDGVPADLLPIVSACLTKAPDRARPRTSSWSCSTGPASPTPNAAGTCPSRSPRRSCAGRRPSSHRPRPAHRRRHLPGRRPRSRARPPVRGPGRPARPAVPATGWASTWARPARPRRCGATGSRPRCHWAGGRTACRRCSTCGTARCWSATPPRAAASPSPSTWCASSSAASATTSRCSWASRRSAPTS